MESLPARPEALHWSPWALIKTIFVPAASMLIRAGRYVVILIIEHRTAQAQAYLAQRLPMMSDSELAALGIRREEIPQYIKDHDE